MLRSSDQNEITLPNEAELGDLYSNEQLFPILNEKAQAKFDKYIALINDTVEQIANDPDPRISWSNFTRNFFKIVMLDAMEALQIPVQLSHHETTQFNINLALYFCGSIAKQQATVYSDIDGFILCETKEDREKIRPVLKAMYHLFQRIFTKTHHFCPDPLGMTPFDYFDTPDNIFNQLLANKKIDIPIYVNSLFNAVCLFGNESLLEGLQRKIIQEPALQITAEICYAKAVEQFAGPRSIDMLDLKRDIFRPLDFILMGLRIEFNLNSQEYLDIQRTVDELIKINVLSPGVGTMMLQLFYLAYDLRSMRHSNEGLESDAIDISTNPTQSRELIDMIAILRGIASRRLHNMRQGLDVSKRPFDFYDAHHTTLPYQSGNHFSMSEMKLDISPFITPKSATDEEVKDNKRNALRLILLNYQAAHKDKYAKKSTVRLFMSTLAGHDHDKEMLALDKLIQALSSNITVSFNLQLVAALMNTTLESALRRYASSLPRNFNVLVSALDANALAEKRARIYSNRK
jgi:hypothetical protein